MLTEVKRHMTKNNTAMAFLSIEDATGSVEAVVFSDAFSRLEPFLLKDSHLMLWGKVDYRDDRVQLIIEDAEPVEQVKYIKLELTPHDATTPERQTQLKLILQAGTGRSKVPIIAIINDGNERYIIRLGEKFWAQDASLTLESLEKANFNASCQALVN
jgi:DNA polymerase III subunit alpha